VSTVNTSSRKFRLTERSLSDNEYIRISIIANFQYFDEIILFYRGNIKNFYFIILIEFILIQIPVASMGQFFSEHTSHIPVCRLHTRLSGACIVTKSWSGFNTFVFSR